MGIFFCCKTYTHVIEYACHHDFVMMGCQNPLHEASTDEILTHCMVCIFLSGMKIAPDRSGSGGFANILNKRHNSS